MRKIVLCVLFMCLLVFAGCDSEMPADTKQFITPTTEPLVTYVPQDEDTLEYPEDSIQATVIYFAGMLYVNDNRADALVEKLPDGYIYVGVTGNTGSASRIPQHALVNCHIPANTEFYCSLQNPDYIYYALDNKYRRMIHAGLVENYWDEQEIDPNVPENYTELFFESLLTATFSQNRYHCATYSEFDNPKDIDLYYLFYNGFYEEKRQQITEAEQRFLLSDGWGDTLPVSNAIRLPVEQIDTDLQRFFGIGYSDVSGIGMKKWESYWTETDCYYVWRSDTIGTKLVVNEVSYDQSSGIYAVTYTPEFGQGSKVMRLQLADNIFQILSNKTK